MIKQLLCLLGLSLVHANVIGFDFGSTFFKITLVKPGSPFSIVENSTSMRKTPSMMTFGPETRLWSSDSFVNASRYPKTTFADSAKYLGKTFDTAELSKLAERKFVLNDFVEDDRGQVAW